MTAQDILNELDYKEVAVMVNLGYNSGGYTEHEINRDIESYDITIGGKEIPAYFLGMVETYHCVKVEPYVHYWGENVVDVRKMPYSHWGQLRTVRQY